MILGNITGKTSTLEFSFLVKQEVNKFDYVQVVFKEKYVLAQILEIEKSNATIAKCNIIGYRDEDKLKRLLSPLEPGSEVLKADEDFIKEILDLKQNKNAAFVGSLQRYSNLKVYLDLNVLLTKHISILAKSGSGKSYVGGVLVEEILERDIPLLIIDPHGEYSSLNEKNEDENLSRFDLNAKDYKDKIRIYSPNTTDNPECIPLKLSNFNLSSQEILHVLPTKLSNIQLGLLYSSLKDVSKIDFNQLILELELEENPAKYTLINTIRYLDKLNLFSDAPTSLQELISPGKCSILNMKGVEQELQEVVVYKLVKDLFEERKKGNIPPFFLIIEEAHNYLPERSFGEAKSSRILRQVASEGRKFGLGLCVISQRPSRLDKSVISQCSTQIILKVTNPNDLRAIANSVEGLTYESEKEIKNLNVGTALITGVAELPLFVNIRPRMTKHGGEAVDMLNITNSVGEEEKGELLQVIKQKTSKEDLDLMGENVNRKLIPCLYVQTEDYNLLVNLSNGKLINNLEKGEGKDVIKKLELSPQQKRVFDSALTLREFTAAELFSKAGVQFSEIYDIVNILVNKGYFIKEGEKYKLSNVFDIDFKNFKVYDKPDYHRVEGVKLGKNFNVYDIVGFLGNFVDIKNEKECWLEVYN
tara:strand:+ start:2249 stop:4183 length:1935 start_codon:yes stop_codon:yes gene_type:complete